jgi:hypothetical protein
MLAIVHLSDIHLTKVIGDNPILDRVGNIASAVGSRCDDCDGILLLVTGDIAQSGAIPEYQEARLMVDELLDAIRERVDCPIGVISTPGNHDCDHSKPNSVRNALLKTPTADLDAEIVSSCLDIQENYRVGFEDRWLPTGTVTDIPDPALRDYQFSLGRWKISVRSINSAAFSRIKELQSTLRLAPATLHALEQPNGSADVSMTLFHHPYPWFEADCAKSLRNAIWQSTDIVFTGHEHDGEAFYQASDEASTEYVEAPVLQDRHNGESSGFSIISVDPSEATYSVQIWTWSQDMYVPLRETPPRQFQRNQQRLRREFNFTNEFERELDDIGVVFTHPRTNSVRRSDVFVYPHLKESRSAGSDASRPRNARDFIESNELGVVLGQEKSGKTTLAKQAILDLAATGVVPLLIDGSAIAGTSVPRLRNLIARIAKEQYSFSLAERYMQLPAKRKAVVVDNFDHVGKSSDMRREVASMLAKRFGRVLLFTGTDPRLDGLSHRSTPEQDASGTNLLLDFAHAELIQLGHVKRSELVTKWQRLGRPTGTFSEKDLQKTIASAETALTSLMGNNLIHPYPIFVLALLQQLESKERVGASAGSQGYLYEALIFDSIRAVTAQNHQIDSAVNYLTNVAWYLRTKKTKYITIDSLRSWHAKYCVDYKVHLDFEPFVSQLTSSGLLRQFPDRYEFSYPYAYYYFLARYFRENLVSPTVRNEIEALAKSLHSDEAANILLFTAYLCKDPLVLDAITIAIENMFDGVHQASFVKGTEFYNKLSAMAQQFELDRRVNPEENRQRELAELDDREASLIETETKANPTTQADERALEFVEEDIQFSNQFNGSSRAVQVVGQILRNYSGSLPGEKKIELVQTCYSVALRLLGFWLEILENEGEHLIKHVLAMLKKMHPEASKHRLNSEAQFFVFSLAHQMTFGVVKHLSESIGLEHLAPVFGEVSQNRSDPTYAIIEMSIRLDHYRHFPEAEILQLQNTIKNNPFASALLRRLVWHHLYVFREDYKVVQSVCSKLGISVVPEFGAHPKAISNIPKPKPTRPR